MWDTFCDLAMAGGPPHKGRLLEPASPAAIDAQPDRYAAVVEEIARGIRMVSGLDAEPAAPRLAAHQLRERGDGRLAAAGDRHRERRRAGGRR